MEPALGVLVVVKTIRDAGSLHLVVIPRNIVSVGEVNVVVYVVQVATAVINADTIASIALHRTKNRAGELKVAVVVVRCVCVDKIDVNKFRKNAILHWHAVVGVGVVMIIVLIVGLNVKQSHAVVMEQAANVIHIVVVQDSPAVQIHVVVGEQGVNVGKPVLILNAG